MPTWLAVHRSKAVFFLTLYDSINCMKQFRNVCITPHPCHSHVCCWLLPILSMLDIWAENGAYCLCWLFRRYNGAKLYIFWPYMIVSMILKSDELSALHLSHATAMILMFIAANFILAGFLGWTRSLWPVPDWLAVQRSKAVFFLFLYDSINDMKDFWTVWITPQTCHSHFWCWLLPIWP